MNDNDKNNSYSNKNMKKNDMKIDNDNAKNTNKNKNNTNKNHKNNSNNIKKMSNPIVMEIQMANRKIISISQCNIICNVIWSCLNNVSQIHSNQNTKVVELFLSNVHVWPVWPV